MFASFLIGTQFILAFLTLIFYFRVKHKAYLYYALHVISIAGYAAFCWARIDPAFKESFFIGPSDQYFHYLAPFSTLAMISIVNFIRYFLSLDVILPTWDKIMKWLGWLGTGILISTLICFTPMVWEHRIAARLLEFYIFIVSLTGIAFILPLLRKVKSTNKYFVLGFCSLVLIATIAVFLRYFGVSYFYYFVVAAVLIESILFALALAEQQRIKDKERNSAFIELEKAKNQQKLDQLENARIKELEEVRNSFYTNLTHEFRTPLTVIMGMAENMLVKYKDPELKQSSKLILRNGAAVLNMINQLLDIAKSDTGNLSIDLYKGDIINFIHYVSESFFAIASEKKIQLSFHAKPEQLIGDFDADKLKHVIQNILSNAIKYTKPGGKIIVMTELASDISLLLRIKDTGVGIEEEDLPHIFERFYQAKNSSAGTGIGLALSKEFVDLMNGSISVESEVGWGTEMNILLPIFNHDDTPRLNIEVKNLMPSNKGGLQSVALHDEPVSSSEKPLVLLVEDNIGVLSYVQSLLSQTYQVIVGINGKEGMTLALERIPDIIITDVMMPEMNGFEMTNSLKQDIRTSHIPIIMLTAKADQQSRVSGLLVGADVYINKPFERKELLLQISNLLRTRKIIFEKYAHQSKQDSFIKKDTNGYSSNQISIEDQFITKVNQLIDEWIGQKEIDSNKIAYELELSPIQLKRKLKALTNKTTNQYIKSRQLYRAQRLLHDLNLSISEIGYQVGFNDPNYFVRVFKSEFGVPPGLYRKEEVV